MPTLKKDVQPTLAEADAWFTDTIIPKRTASAGFSMNRVWKSPRALLKGNTEDPDGLCGDAAAFVYEEFWRESGDYTTRDKFQIGLILWTGTISNHIANVMLPKTKTAVQQYSWDAKTRKLKCGAGRCQYDRAELLMLHVYDLYYKKRSTLEMWWRERDAAMDGVIKLGLLHNIDQ